MCNMGWICPRCGRGNAPWKETCDCGPNYSRWTDTAAWPWWPNTNPIPSTGDPLPQPAYTICKSKEEVK